MNATLLITAVLCGPLPDVPTKKLFIGSHSGTAAARQIRYDVSCDPDMPTTFEVIYEERAFMEPRYKFDSRDVYKPWPKPEGARTAFGTPGMALIWLKPELNAQLAPVPEQGKFVKRWVIMWNNAAKMFEWIPEFAEDVIGE